MGHLAGSWRVVIPLGFVIGLLVRGWRGVTIWVLLFCHWHWLGLRGMGLIMGLFGLGYWQRRGYSSCITGDLDIGVVFVS